MNAEQKIWCPTAYMHLCVYACVCTCNINERVSVYMKLHESPMYQEIEHSFYYFKLSLEGAKLIKSKFLYMDLFFITIT